MPALRPALPCRLAMMVVAACCVWSTDSLLAQTGRTVPTQDYFRGIEQLYRGDYRDAERIFRREWQGSIKSVQARWIDSICYHAMWGEVFYHQGRLELALEQYNLACTMFLQYPQWLLRVRFTEPSQDTNLARRGVPWGASKRQTPLSRHDRSMLVGQGDLYSGNRAAQEGGVVNLPHYWSINVTEIVRCTTLAIRRRNELLGPLGLHDPMSRDLVAALRRGGAPPNHWSNALVKLQLGVAQAGVGENAQALRALSQAEMFQGRFDHSLTCVALLEKGRLMMEAGKASAAAELFSEASYLAYYYDDFGVVDDAFRFAGVNRLSSSTGGIDPLLQPASAWARQKRYDHLFCRISLSLTEQLMAGGDWESAGALLTAIGSRLQDAQTGQLGVRALYLDARLQFQQQRESATNALMQALQQQSTMSPRNLQIGLTNQWFDNQRLADRQVIGLYAVLLDDPTVGDWLFRPLDTLAVMKTPHQEAFDRWLAALISRKDRATALEVTDRAKRRRYLRSLPWGGRLAALRQLLEKPEQALSGPARLQRKDLLLRYPQYEQLLSQDRQLLEELRTDWRAGLDDRQKQKLVRTWRDWSKNLSLREVALEQIGLQRVAADQSSPPLATSAQIKEQLKPGQALVMFHNTPNGLLGFLISSGGATFWNCGPAGQLAGPVSKLLRDLGNHDGNRPMPADELMDRSWELSGAKVYQALFQGSSIDPEAIRELIIVPDGIVWYVPLGALPVPTEEGPIPLVSMSRIRYAPTVGWALSASVPPRRVQRSAVVAGSLLPGESDEARAEALATLTEVVETLIDLPTPLPTDSPLVASLLDALVVLDDTELDLAEPWSWSPLPQARGGHRGTLDRWLALPQFGPRWMVLPGVRTLAERGGRNSKRRSIVAAPGSELFLASCALLDSGARTVLLSRWRVGGASTLELVREFIQELPHTTPADAWQRSVELAMELPIDPLNEPRVKPDDKQKQPTAAHPFFWSGYLLIDAGVTADQDEQKSPQAAAEPAARLGAADP